MENIKKFPEQNPTIEEIRNNLLRLLTICDSSPDFLNYVQEELRKIENRETLYQIKLSLEKIQAGLLSLSSIEPERKDTLEEINERSKAVCLVKEGWHNLKETLNINKPVRIEETLRLIEKNHVN
ncbi:MAG: hypothetical protein V3574_00485 [Candidatus Moraniibacteriota bacterium]